MPKHQSKLSEPAAAILRLIAEGNSYEQVLSRLPHLRYPDIFAAAAEALSLAAAEAGTSPARLAEIRRSHPRAYEPWADAEDDDLVASHRKGATIAQIAKALQRQPTAVQARLRKQGLIQ